MDLAPCMFLLWSGEKGKYLSDLLYIADQKTQENSRDVKLLLPLHLLTTHLPSHMAKTKVKGRYIHPPHTIIPI